MSQKSQCVGKVVELLGELSSSLGVKEQAKITEMCGKGRPAGLVAHELRLDLRLAKVRSLLWHFGEPDEEVVTRASQLALGGMEPVEAIEAARAGSASAPSRPSDEEQPNPSAPRSRN